MVINQDESILAGFAISVVVVFDTVGDFRETFTVDQFVAVGAFFAASVVHILETEWNLGEALVVI